MRYDMTNYHDKILCERLATSIDHGICKCAERSRIAALEAELAVERDRLEAKKLEVDAAMDCYKAALNAMRKDWREMFESTQAAGVELAAERERREAANGLLHFYADLANAAMVGANRDGAEYDRAAEMLDYRRYCKRYKND